MTRGWRTTAASKMLAGYVSPFDAAVVDRWREAQADPEAHAGRRQARHA